MAMNCPFWRNGHCVPPGDSSGADCSWPHQDYKQCCVYGTLALRNSGASMADVTSFQNDWLSKAPAPDPGKKKPWRWWK